MNHIDPFDYKIITKIKEEWINKSYTMSNSYNRI